MQNKNCNLKDILLNIIGIFLLSIGLFATIHALSLGNNYQILWFCYSALILSGIGILFKNLFLIIAQLNISFIPLIFWDIDFFYELLNEKELWGVTSYFFVESFSNLAKFISLQHVYFIPLVIMSLFLIITNTQKLDISKVKNAWKLSFIEIILIFILGRFLTPLNANMNCVFESCIPLIFGFLYKIPYEILWFLVMFFIISISNFFFFWILNKYLVLSKKK